MNTVKLLIDDDLTTTTSPDRVTAVLEANSDAESINLINCSAQQLLNFILEVQKCAIDQYLCSATEEEEKV